MIRHNVTSFSPFVVPQGGPTSNFLLQSPWHCILLQQLWWSSPASCTRTLRSVKKGTILISPLPSRMKNPFLGWVFLIPWALQFLLLTTISGFENPFRPRGASLFNSRTSSTLSNKRSHYYYYDPIAPVRYGS